MTSPSTSHHDVIVVGAGPVGLLIARLLGSAGHDVQVVERWPQPYPLPRAVHFDHEIGRVLQGAGLADQVRAISEPVPDFYEWRNSDGASLLRIDWSRDGECGWPIANFFSQPQLEGVLAESLTELPTVTLSRGLEAVGLTETDDGVEVTVTGQTLKQKQIHARYVIGCDGANSFVRQHMNTALTDLGFYFDWLIVDVLPHEEREWSPMNWQLCDPQRPTTVVSGGPGRRRWEFMRLPGEDREQLNLPETVWRLLEPWGRNPANSTIERHAIYTFQARWADTWNQGRLLVAGDAAHLMPPFAGQGMCSGLRDAANLSWKLDRVLRGASRARLLDTYTTERRAHLQHAISLSVELGRTICVLDPDEAHRRDERMIAAGADPRTALPPMPPEQLGLGAWDREVTPETLQGRVTPQFRVADERRTGLLDDLLDDGPAFTLLGFDMDPAGGLDEAGLSILDSIGIRSVMLLEKEPADGFMVSSKTRCLVTADDTARTWFSDNGIGIVLVRPDFYVHSAAERLESAGELLRRLQTDLTP
jgi:2-polyprenyl-6-methoxyphenol hydroxylase-like FAD-dependent oxidoreductase